MSRKSQWGFKTESQHVEKYSMGIPDWVSEYQESLNEVLKLGLRMPRESQRGFN